MEKNIEARALKPSFLQQMYRKNNSYMLLDEDGVNGCDAEDFFVEDLLDIPENEFHEGFFYQESGEEETLSPKRKKYYGYGSESGEFKSLSAGELVIPIEEMENLEWLSQFVEDSSSGLSLLCPSAYFNIGNGGISSNAPPPRQAVDISRYQRIPKGRRSSRSRSSRRSWSMLPSSSLSPSESSSTTSRSSDGSSTFPTFPTNPVRVTPRLSFPEIPPCRRLKTDGGSGSLISRRCTHCQVLKTPQWRTGPLGPKTLCNACGVRFKSGRLFPEYRPACSPSSSHEIHSNCHRKVLEIRRNKEIIVEPV